MTVTLAKRWGRDKISLKLEHFPGGQSQGQQQVGVAVTKQPEVNSLFYFSTAKRTSHGWIVGAARSTESCHLQAATGRDGGLRKVSPEWDIFYFKTGLFFM